MAVIKLKDQGIRGVEPLVLTNLAEVSATPRIRPAQPSSGGRMTPVVHGDVQERVEEIIRAAEEQATQTLEDAVRFAEEEGQAIMEAAQEEGFNKGKEAGFQAGREDGYREGFQNGLEAGKSRAEEEYRVLLASVSEIASVLREPRSPLDDCSLDGLLDLSLAIAQKIVSLEVVTNPRCALANVMESLGRCNGAVRATLRLNPDDAGTVIERVDEIRRDCGLDHLHIVEDSTVGRGGCITETPEGMVDSRIETKLGEIIRELREECTSQNSIAEDKVLGAVMEEAGSFEQH